MEEKRIEADVLNSLIMIPTYFPDVNHLSKISEKDFMIVYKKVVSPYINSYSMKVNLNPAYLQLGVYRQVVRGILEKINSDKYKVKMIKDWMRAVDMVAKFKTLTERKRLDIFSKEINGIKTKKYKDAVVQAFEKLMKLRNGDEVVNFTMTNTRGELISLDSFKGKVIYIDFWATWCLPCLTELTYLDSLKKRYHKNDNIILISLSIDVNKQEWLKKVINRSENNNEYIIDRLDLESYSVTEIPRTLLIDKDFKIVSMEANLPSDRNLVKVLDELLK